MHMSTASYMEWHSEDQPLAAGTQVSPPSSGPDNHHGSGCCCLAHLPQHGHLFHRGAAALRPTPSQTLSKERPSVSGSKK